MTDEGKVLRVGDRVVSPRSGLAVPDAGTRGRIVFIHEDGRSYPYEVDWDSPGWTHCASELRHARG